MTGPLMAARQARLLRLRQMVKLPRARQSAHQKTCPSATIEIDCHLHVFSKHSRSGRIGSVETARSLSAQSTHWTRHGGFFLFLLQQQMKSQAPIGRKQKGPVNGDERERVWRLVIHRSD